MSNACCNSLSLSSFHLPDLPLDPLVGSLVACQRLTSLYLGRVTSLELKEVTLSLQSLLAVVKGLHNLRALGLGVSSSEEEEASSSDERVSD